MNMVRCKSRYLTKQVSQATKEAKLTSYEIVAVVVTLVAPNSHLKFIVTCITSSFREIFWKELTLLVISICRAL